jgi:alpha-amylase/alpha-mannosidase (GH57 family)
VFDGNDNELDVLNTQLEIANRFVADLLRGSLNDMNIETVGEPLAEPFVDRFENKLAGWTLTFDALVPNNMTIC